MEERKGPEIDSRAVDGDGGGGSHSPASPSFLV